jgi:site-specific DNA recombinase
MPRVVVYARYSSDSRREASIEDQIRLCRQHAAQEGWTVANVYADDAISGASLATRPGIQHLMQDVLSGKVDIVLAEALDRLAPDQKDLAGLCTRMEYAGVVLVTISEGEISFPPRTVRKGSPSFTVVK